MNRGGLKGVVLGCVMTATFLAASLKLEGSGDSRLGWLPSFRPTSSGNPGDSRISDTGHDSQEAPAAEEKKVHVGGQARKTGAVDFKEGMTAEQAIAAAGGETEFGAIRRVELLRAGKLMKVDLTTPDGRSFPLKNNDTLTIPEKSCEGGR